MGDLYVPTRLLPADYDVPYRYALTSSTLGIEALGPIPALIGARSRREPPTVPLASSGGLAMRWGLCGMTPTLLSRPQGIISR